MECNIHIFSSYHSDGKLNEKFLMIIILLLYTLREKNRSKYCTSTKHDSRDSYYVIEVSFIRQKFAGLYPVRCDYWLYQIVKFEFRLAFTGETVIPDFSNISQLV